MSTPYIQRGKETPDGWDSFVLPLIDLFARSGVEILQIKQKFGMLRVYHAATNDEGLLKAVDRAEDLSKVTCEICGTSPSKRVSIGGWISCLCPVHELEARERCS